MSDLFNLFDRSPTTHLAPPSGFSETRLKHPLQQRNATFRSPQYIKSLAQMATKPKGLSMRSTSDLNIYCGNTLPVVKSDKKDNFLSVKSIQTDSFGQPMSPARQKFMQKQSLRFEQKRGVFLKRKSPIKDPKKFMNDVKLKKLYQKEKELIYPEPERLSYCFDEEEEFYKNCTKNLDIEFKKLKMYIPQTEDDDEGFVSDPEVLSAEEIPYLKRKYTEDSDDELKFNMELDSPDISDIEDF